MIDLRQLDRFRDPQWEDRIAGKGADFPRADVGAFLIPSCEDGQPLRCIVSAGRADPAAPWDHVSASRKDRVPSYAEMDQIYRAFFRPGEVAMQLHVPDDQHVNVHPNCLHLWRPTGLKKIPLPPHWLVGPKATGRAKAG